MSWTLLFVVIGALLPIVVALATIILGLKYLTGEGPRAGGMAFGMALAFFKGLALGAIGGLAVSAVVIGLALAIKALG